MPQSHRRLRLTIVCFAMLALAFPAVTMAQDAPPDASEPTEESTETDGEEADNPTSSASNSSDEKEDDSEEESDQEPPATEDSATQTPSSDEPQQPEPPPKGPTSASEDASRSADEGATGDKSSAASAASDEATSEAASESPNSSEQTSDSADDTPDAGDSVVASDLDKPSIYVASNEEDDEGPDWRIGVGGYLRTKFTHIQDDPEVDFVGRNDGFILGDARLSLHGTMENGLGFMFEFDGVVDLPDTETNSPIRNVGMRMKDVFSYYKPFDQLRISLGQFKPPYDVEELTSNSDLLFVNESVASRGVENVEGFNVDGLSLTREVGLRVDGEPYFFLAEGDDSTGPGVSYALAVTNGQTANRNLNDNDRLAYYGRGALHWGSYVRLGGGYFLNDQSRGERPDLVDVETRGWTADLTFTGFGVTAMGSIMQQTESPFQGDAAEEAATTARGYQAQIAYEEPFLGLQPAYRYAYYDPSADYGGDIEAPESTFEIDARTYHTVGLNYNAHNYPVRVMVDYTFTQEQDRRQLDNNRLDALVQLSW